MEHFFPQIQIKTKKKRFLPKMEHFFSPNSSGHLPTPRVKLLGGMQMYAILKLLGGIQSNYWGDIFPPGFGTPDRMQCVPVC